MCSYTNLPSCWAFGSYKFFDMKTCSIPLKSVLLGLGGTGVSMVERIIRVKYVWIDCRCWLRYAELNELGVAHNTLDHAAIISLSHTHSLTQPYSGIGRCKGLSTTATVRVNTNEKVECFNATKQHFYKFCRLGSEPSYFFINLRYSGTPPYGHFFYAAKFTCPFCWVADD